MRRRVLIVMLLIVGLLAPGLPALAINEHLCAGVPAAGFTDVPATSPFAADIDCLVAYEISQGTGLDTFSPTAPVERWQMALFLWREWLTLGYPLLSGEAEFTDVGELDFDTIWAIDQAEQLGITSGVSPGLFDPFGTVPRWQMALFLARFVKASGYVVPAVSPHGFDDVDGLSTEAQDAIAVVKTLGITTGTSFTTFSPHEVVSREQMASFLVRTMQTLYTISIDGFITDCDFDDLDVFRCTGSGEYPAGVPLRFQHGVYLEPGDDYPGFHSPETKFEVYVDGFLQPANQLALDLPGVSFRWWEVQLPAGLVGTHNLEVRNIIEGELVFVVTATVTFS